ncbi:MAG TPA: type II secretion system F family protein [Gemmatimonadaceae bacterium]|jgi:tight adherence protein C|nr:type II secretion system F family protein [Gemmatimonadaceae bacterium]
MLISLILLILVAAMAIAAAVYAAQAEWERRAMLGRIRGSADGRTDAGAGERAVRPSAWVRAGARIGRWLAEKAPASWSHASDASSALVNAGYDGAAAPIIYGSVRVGSAILFPMIGLVLAPRHGLVLFVSVVGLAAAVGLLTPPAVLARLASRRQRALRRALPDAMDLLVVCVEAGISLDAAMLRVAREMGAMHPELAGELLLVNRRMNAGVTRENALHGLSTRTGVAELRALASNLIQSERWGTSVATVLRVYAETLRRQRQQLAEKRAATAPLKMLFPLGLFIFPSIFIVIIGPAFVKIVAMFYHLNQ